MCIRDSRILILAVGTRISIRQVGYNWKTWARAAEVIMVDIDQAELKKPTLHVEMPVWADAKDFLTKLDKVAAAPVNAGGEWLATCQRWKRDYPAVDVYKRQGSPTAGCPRSERASRRAAAYGWFR